MISGGGVRHFKLIFGAIFALVLFCVLFVPGKTLAARQLTLSPSSTTVEADKIFEVKVEINTDGEKINTVSFKVNFPTEVLDGQLPSLANSNFPFCAVLSATKVSCGAPVAGGVAVNGTVATLVFKGRHSGEALIELSDIEIQQVHEEIVDGKTKAVVQNLSGFSSNPVNMIIYAAGEKPPVTNNPGQESNSSTSHQTSSASNANNNPAVAAPTTSVEPVQPPTELMPPGIAEGSIPQVIGPTGSSPEDTLKFQATENEGEIKGSFAKSPLNIGYITTILMLIVTGYLGVKLYFTEKRRHLEMERLFEDQIGTLSALESKIDVFDQKGEGAKEKLIQEFEEAKIEINTKASPPKQEAKKQ